MKAVHKNRNDGEEEAGSWLDKAKDLEQQGELEKAAAAFEKVIKENPTNELAYDRLTIIYRKQKEFKKELAVIKKGITAFEQLYRSATKLTVTKKIAAISRSLLKSMGLVDKKGRSLYEKEPLGRWNKRKLMVEKRLKKRR